MTSRSLMLLMSFLLVACSDDNSNDNNPYADYSSALYDDQQNWLCRPDIEGFDNVCSRDLSTTIVFADGTTQLEEEVIVDSPPVDCFYVYPTVSSDSTDNSDLQADAEIAITYAQAARYRSVCRIFAPLYRQVTLAGLVNGGFSDDAIVGLAYADVLDAFKYFIANGEGRGFILIGHSQGSGHLIRIIQQEVENDKYLSSRMISAHLIGSTVALPNDAEVGATFQSTLPCTFRNDIHCFVNYASFRETDPPQASNALFGITASADTRATCTHPVDLGAGKLNLDSYFLTNQLKPLVDRAANAAITTPFVKVPGLLQGECIEEDGKAYLAISVDADPADPRVDDTIGDFLPGWGLHLIDISLAQGDLVRLAAKQAEAYQ